MQNESNLVASCSLVVCFFCLQAASYASTGDDPSHQGPGEPLRDDTICLASNAAMLWYNQPAAVFFHGEHARTYYGYLTNRAKVLVGAYDHQSRSLLPSVAIAQWEKVDDHGAPSLWVVRNGLNKGRIIAFYSFHSSPMFYRLSAAAEDISTWEPEQPLDEDRCTYSSAIELDGGRLLVFYTVQVKEQDIQRRLLAVRHSDDGGRSWSDRTTVVDFGPGSFPYTAPVASKGDTLFLAWTVYRRKGEVGHRNVYSIGSPDGGRTWQTADGKIVPLPIGADSCDVVYRTPAGKENVVWDTCLDEEGTPVIAFIEHDPVGREGWNNCEAFVTRLDGETLKWSPPSPVVPLGSCCYPSGIVIDRRNTRRVVAGHKTDDGSSLECFEQMANGQWTATRKFAPGGPALQMHPVIPRFQQDGLDLIWLDVCRYQTGREFSCRLMGRISPDGGGPATDEAEVPLP